MRPKEPLTTTTDDLFRARLSNIINPRHEVVRLAQMIDWRMFETAFGPLYAEVGRPGLPTRLMVGLHLLKHVLNLSDEVVCARWVENPYYQHFCGFDYFRHDLPVDRSSMTRWRERIGAGGMEVLLKATIEAGLDGGVVAPKELERVTVDTTVQPKAVAPPSDAPAPVTARKEAAEEAPQKPQPTTLAESRSVEVVASAPRPLQEEAKTNKMADRAPAAMAYSVSRKAAAPAVDYSILKQTASGEFVTVANDSIFAKDDHVRLKIHLAGPGTLELRQQGKVVASQTLAVRQDQVLPTQGSIALSAGAALQLTLLPVPMQGFTPGAAQPPATPRTIIIQLRTE